MEAIAIAVAARAMGAEVRGAAGGAPVVAGVCTDTRQGANGALFFALRGENADGHAYVGRAFGAGAAAAVVEHDVAPATGPLLVVPDSLRALGDLARAYRDRFAIPVVAITGSVGKTSTKEMVAAALRAKLNVLASEKNFNNEMGVPLTLFGLERAHQAAVVEMGMRLAGEIARLAEIARPTIGVITNIGLSHIERLGSREGIARAKRELVEALPADGLAVLPADDDFSDFLRAGAHCRVATYGVRNPADFRATDVEFTPEGGSRFRVNGQPFAVRAPGVHHIVNACAACAVAAELGIGLEAVAAQVEAFRAPAMRMETIEAPNGVTVLNDAYNAAPDSMRAALQTLALLAGGSNRSRRSVAILGDMKELGDFSAEAHRYVGEQAAAQGVGLLVTVGEAARGIAEAALPALGAARIHSFPDTETAARAAGALLRPGDLVLVKGSRAMEMERVVEALSVEC